MQKLFAVEGEPLPVVTADILLKMKYDQAKEEEEEEEKNDQ